MFAPGTYTQEEDVANRIVGFFKDPGQAGQTILALVNAGYARADIDLFLR